MPGPRLRPTHRVHGYRFLDSFAELCRHTRLEGLYSGRWYRVAVAGVDGAGARLLYLDTDETEVLRPADFERGSWRARGGSRAGGGAPLPEVALQGSGEEESEEKDSEEEKGSEEEEGSEEEDSEEEEGSEEEESEGEDSEEEDGADEGSAEEGSAEEGRLLGSLLEVAGSLLARA
jgi:Mg-chelatase subunit ChlI